MSEISKEVRDAVLGTHSAWLPYVAALAEVDTSFRGPACAAAPVVEADACDFQPGMRQACAGADEDGG